MVRGALVSLLDLEPDLEVVADVGRGDEVLAAVEQHRPDVVVMDIEMPGIDGLTAVEQLIEAGAQARVLVLTGLGKAHHVQRAMQLRVPGFLPKDAPAEQLASAIRTIHDGGQVVDPTLVQTAFQVGANPLTAREMDVLRESRSGASTRDTAKALSLSAATVRNYTSAAIAKLNARNRADAARIADEAGWL